MVEQTPSQKEFATVLTPQISELKGAIERGPGYPEVVFDQYGADQLAELGRVFEKADLSQRLNIAVFRFWNRSDVSDLLELLNTYSAMFPLHGTLLLINEAADEDHQTFFNIQSELSKRSQGSPVVSMGVRQAAIADSSAHIKHGWSYTSPLNCAAATMQFLRIKAGKPLQPCTFFTHSYDVRVHDSSMDALSRSLSSSAAPALLSVRHASDAVLANMELISTWLTTLLSDVFENGIQSSSKGLLDAASEYKQWLRNTLAAWDLEDDIVQGGGFPNLFDGRQRPVSTLGDYAPAGVSPDALIGKSGMEDHALGLLLYRQFATFRARIEESLRNIVIYDDPSLGRSTEKAERALTSAPHRADAAMLTFTNKDETGKIEHEVFRRILQEGRVPVALSDFIFLNS